MVAARLSARRASQCASDAASRKARFPPQILYPRAHRSVRGPGLFADAANARREKISLPQRRYASLSHLLAECPRSARKLRRQLRRQYRSRHAPVLRRIRDQPPLLWSPVRPHVPPNARYDGCAGGARCMGLANGCRATNRKQSSGRFPRCPPPRCDVWRLGVPRPLARRRSRSHQNALGPQHHGCGKAAPICKTTGGDDRYVRTSVHDLGRQKIKPAVPTGHARLPRCLVRRSHRPRPP